MKGVELVWNIVYYFIYKKYEYFFNKINPYYSKDNSKYSRAISFMFILSLLIGVDFFCILQAILSKNYLSNVVLFIMMLIFVIINYFLLVYRNKCVIYFKEFEVKPKQWKAKWGWISLGIIIAIILLLIISFKIMDYSLHSNVSNLGMKRVRV